MGVFISGGAKGFQGEEFFFKGTAVYINTQRTIKLLCMFHCLFIIRLLICIIDSLLHYRLK